MSIPRDKQMSFMACSKGQLLGLVRQTSENGDFFCSESRANKRKQATYCDSNVASLYIHGSFTNQLKRTAIYNLPNVEPTREIKILWL
jgi:hypothetical protein